MSNHRPLCHKRMITWCHVTSAPVAGNLLYRHRCQPDRAKTHNTNARLLICARPQENFASPNPSAGTGFQLANHPQSSCNWTVCLVWGGNLEKNGSLDRCSCWDRGEKEMGWGASGNPWKGGKKIQGRQLIKSKWETKLLNFDT